MILTIISAFHSIQSFGVPLSAGRIDNNYNYTNVYDTKIYMDKNIATYTINLLSLSN
jgi:hypothetical protein